MQQAKINDQFSHQQQNLKHLHSFDKQTHQDLRNPSAMRNYFTFLVCYCVTLLNERNGILSLLPLFWTLAQMVWWTSEHTVSVFICERTAVLILHHVHCWGLIVHRGLPSPNTSSTNSFLDSSYHLTNTINLALSVVSVHSSTAREMHSAF